MKYLISAGPTTEKIDSVRFISNRSSGKMGYALAAAAMKAGNKVTLVSGPVSIVPPKVDELIIIESAKEMAEAIKSKFFQADVIIMAAAVADYTPVKVYDKKIKKSEENMVLELTRTEDILASIGKLKKDRQLLVGFAAESSDLIKNGQEKLKRKKADWIIANDISKQDRGFGVDKNAVTLISANGNMINIPLLTKKKLAEKIISLITPK